MKLCLLFVLISSAGVFSVEDKNAVLKSMLESFITDAVNNYFKELSKYDPFYIDFAEASYFDQHIRLYNVSSKGFSNVHVSNVKARGLFTKHISLKLSAPKISSSIDEFVITGSSNIRGSSSLQLEKFDVSIDTVLNILTHRIQRFDASFHLEHGDAKIVVFVDNVDYSQEVTDGVNHYLNFSFNNDYELHKEMSDHLRQLLENIW
ncbi:hypothetical protein RN001_007074 [Aquatica leii]|uniref:Uncharacterized protein n=1 Tax=Aquatica leii TaxID=1421715 RepID=A0AAN7QI43_9COLE|nr:hypothetical protein RN001_007074 [Aquatica leii]